MSDEASVNRWLTILGHTVLSVWAYVFMDWLFLATKPSILTPLTLLDSFGVLAASAAILLGLAIPPTFALVALSGLLNRPGAPSRLRSVTNAAPFLVPACALTGTVLLMVDNFTYVLLGFNVGSTTGALRALYGITYVTAFLLILRWLALLPTAHGASGRWLKNISLILAATSFFVVTLRLAVGHDASQQRRATSDATYPNIIIFSSDGINARNMSVYGYGRSTTPFLDSIASRTLLAENAFTNSGPTTGSIASLLSGKSPLTTRVVYRPDVFRGRHQSEHFVGLLKAQGYTTADISVTEFADPRRLNMRGAFDRSTSDFSAEGDSIAEMALYRLGDRLPYSLSTERYFIESSVKRLLERVFHAFFIRRFSDPMAGVTDGRNNWLSDTRRMIEVGRFIGSAPEPWFLNVHLMETHGPKFQVEEHHFSRGAEQSENWMVDFYDDAIRDFDRYVRELFERLGAIGKRTIVVITSDHGMRWSTSERIPLIIYFPDARRTGRIHANVQRLDIAPTVLEYLDIPQVDWLEGQSLLTSDPQSARFILSVRVGLAHKINNIRQVKDYRPPFFSLGHVDVIQCQNWFSVKVKTPLSLSEADLEERRVEGHTSPCAMADRATAPQVLAFIKTNLRARGFPVE